VAEQGAGLGTGQSLFRPLTRAIALVAVVMILLGGGALFGSGESSRQLHWVDFVFGALSVGIVGLVSAFSPLWRLLIGLLVVSPLDQASDVLLGRPDALNPAEVVRQVVESTFLTWVLPYLDPPALVQRWMANAPSRRVTTFRRAGIYIAYGVWLLAVIVATVLIANVAAELVKILAGYPDGDGTVWEVPMRITLGVMLAVAAVLVTAGWLLVRFWRRKKVPKAFPETAREMTPIPDFVADAVRDSADKPV